MMDLRAPSGWFFLLLGMILVALGIIFPGMRARLTDANVNLYCGIVMALFGGVMLLLSRVRLR